MQDLRDTELGRVYGEWEAEELESGRQEMCGAGGISRQDRDGAIGARSKYTQANIADGRTLVKLFIG
jgi:hypothetical protein